MSTSRHAGGQDIGVNVHLLPAEIKSDLHADAVADLVLLVFELWGFVLPEQWECK